MGKSRPLAADPPREGVLPEKVGWGCAALFPKPYPIYDPGFMTKICDIPYPIYDLTKNSEPYYIYDPTIASKSYFRPALQLVP